MVNMGCRCRAWTDHGSAIATDKHGGYGNGIHRAFSRNYFECKPWEQEENWGQDTVSEEKDRKVAKAA